MVTDMISLAVYRLLWFCFPHLVPLFLFVPGFLRVQGKLSAPCL